MQALAVLVYTEEASHTRERTKQRIKERSIRPVSSAFLPSFFPFAFFISSFCLFVVFPLIRLRRHLSFRERLSLSNPCSHIARKVNSSKKHKHTRTHTYTYIRVHAVRCTVTVHHHYLHRLTALFSMYRIWYHPNSTIAQPITHRLSHF